MDDIPKVGDPLTEEQFDVIMEAVGQRQKNFPNEPPVITLAFVFFNIGDQFSPVSCLEGEWSGLKRDIPKGDGVPTCPNGHELTQDAGLTLGWVESP